MASTRLGSIMIPSLLTMNPTNSSSSWKKLHFFTLAYSLACRSRSSTSSRCRWCSSGVLARIVVLLFLSQGSEDSMNLQHSCPGPQVLLELRSPDNFHSSLPFELPRIGLVVDDDAQILQNRAP